MYSFAKVINRRGTGCAKWDGHSEQGLAAEVLPLWVADMDFEVAPQITAAIQKRVAHPIYGYALPLASYFSSLTNWLQRRFGWRVEEDWLLTVPGVVPAINLAIEAFTDPGAAVLIQPPVYPPFAAAVVGSGRRLVKNPLVYKENRYQLDLADFETKIAENNVKLFILCSPHNPVGRVWKPEELKAMGDICLKHNVLIVADEIHQDLTYPGVRHYPLPLVDPAFGQRGVICTAPSKSFNLAGLQTSNIIIPNAGLRERYQQTAKRWGLGKVNLIGLVASEAAYTHGDQWLDEAMAYIAANAQCVRDFFAEQLPSLKVVDAEGLYLLWLDCTELGFSPSGLEEFLSSRARLWLNQGYTFGDEGKGFARLNIACARSLLTQALSRLKAAVDSL